MFVDVEGEFDSGEGVDAESGGEVVAIGDVDGEGNVAEGDFLVEVAEGVVADVGFVVHVGRSGGVVVVG